MSKPRTYDRDVVLDLWARGVSGPDICRRIGRGTPHGVRIVVQRARDRGDPRAVNKGSERLPGARKRLIEEASRRGMDIRTLERRLADLIAADNLFSAVLDG